MKHNDFIANTAICFYHNLKKATKEGIFTHNQILLGNAVINRHPI